MMQKSIKIKLRKRFPNQTIKDGESTVVMNT